jgi:hypothetical protein
MIRIHRVGFLRFVEWGILPLGVNLSNVSLECLHSKATVLY